MKLFFFHFILLNRALTSHSLSFTSEATLIIPLDQKEFTKFKWTWYLFFLQVFFVQNMFSAEADDLKNSSFPHPSEKRQGSAHYKRWHFELWSHQSSTLCRMVQKTGIRLTWPMPNLICCQVHFKITINLMILFHVSMLSKSLKKR